jgi:hypothetical protein
MKANRPGRTGRFVRSWGTLEMYSLIVFGILFLLPILASGQAPAVAPVGQPALEALSYDDFLEELEVRNLKRKPNESSPCRFRALTGGALEMTFDDASDLALTLKLYQVERKLERTSRWMAADVVSVLERPGSPKKWVRAGPDQVTKWLATADLQDYENDMKEFALRSCFARIKLAPDSARAVRDSSEQEYEFLMPKVQGKSLFFKSAVTELSYEALGSRGVAAWLFDQEADLEGSGRRQAGPLGKIDLPSESQKVWRQSIRYLDERNPALEIEYLPRYSESRPAASGVRFQRAENGVSRSSAEAVRVAPDCAEPCQERWLRISALRAHAVDSGFEWKWAGLGNASITNLNDRTNTCGCFRRPEGNPPNGFSIELKNENLAVERDGGRTFELRFGKTDPLVFIEPGSQGESACRAANAFIWSNEGLEDFGDRFFEWVPQLVRNLRLTQEDQAIPACAAVRIPGRIYLPSHCSQVDGYVAKGLCGDVVLHELFHELTGSLVALANAKRVHRVKDTVLDEALSDFFVLKLRRAEMDDGSEYGRSCQNDFKNLRLGGDGHRGQDDLVRFLRLLNDEDQILIGKLAILALMYESADINRFLDEVLNLAIYKLDLGPEKVTPLCEALELETEFRPPACKTYMAIKQIKTPGGEEPCDENFCRKRRLGASKVTEARSQDLAKPKLESRMTPDRQMPLEPVSSSLANSGGTRDGRILRNEPQLEILSLAGKGIELAEREGQSLKTWVIPLKESINPESVHLGMTAQGQPALDVEHPVTRTRSSLVFEAGTFATQEVELAFFPVNLPGILIRRRKQPDVTVEIRESLCKASPFLELDGDRIKALTCDGILAVVSTGENPKVMETLRVPGIVAPIHDVDPLLPLDFDDDGVSEWIVGPMRQKRAGKTIDRIYVMDAGGNDLFQPIEIEGGIIEPPRVTDENGDGCQELELLTSTGVQSFFPLGPCLSATP